MALLSFARGGKRTVERNLQRDAEQLTAALEAALDQAHAHLAEERAELREVRAQLEMRSERLVEMEAENTALHKRVDELEAVALPSYAAICAAADEALSVAGSTEVRS